MLGSVLSEFENLKFRSSESLYILHSDNVSILELVIMLIGSMNVCRSRIRILDIRSTLCRAGTEWGICWLGGWHLNRSCEVSLPQVCVPLRNNIISCVNIFVVSLILGTTSCLISMKDFVWILLSDLLVFMV